MEIKCPNCSAAAEYIPGESEICCECGSELKPETVSASAAAEIPVVTPAVEPVKDPASDGKGIFDNIDFASIFGKKSTVSDDSDNWDLSARSRGIADNIENIDFGFDEPSYGECSHLKVEYNKNVFFLTGSTSVIKLKLTPMDNQIEDLLIFMETDHSGNHSRRSLPVREVLKKNTPVFLQTSVDPGDISGRLCLNFYIGCKVRGEFKYYQFSAEHKVYDSKQSGSSLCSQITINNRQDINSTGASDIHYRDSLGDALKKMTDKALSVNELIDRLNDLPPEFRVQQLTKTVWRPEDVLVKGNLYPAEKLTLEYNGFTIHLLNKPSVKFGRDPLQCDLIVRQRTIPAKEYPNSTVSRKHAEIIYCDDTVKFFDYSSYGTYINGRKPDCSGIPLDLSATVEFGDIHWKMNIQQCTARLPHSICQTCSANKVKSVTFSRMDLEPECYLLIWQCCELGRVIENLTDWTIFSRNGCFFIRTPEQDFYHLRPGQTITSKDNQIKVKYFEQN